MPSISLTEVGLTVPTITFQHEQKLVTRPITDHPPIIQNTRWGAIGTLNILHPGSLLSPPTQINGVTALPAKGKVQMEAMAEYIFKMFQLGVGLLALQEVPDPKTENFKFLKKKLESLVGSSELIDIGALEKQWSKTGTHSFGTTVLYNPNMFHISKTARSDLNHRIAVYEVTAANGEKIPIANIHGDFKDQTGTAQYLDQFEGISLGDLNITYSSIKPTSDSNKIQTIERPTIEVEGVERLTNTVDCIQDNYSKKFDLGFKPDIHEIIIPSKSKEVQNSNFQAKVIKVPAADANSLLKKFTVYLSTAKEHLINENGFIKGVNLKTPHPYDTAHITVTDQEVYQEFLLFQNKQVKKQPLETTQKTTFKEQLIHVPAKEAASHLQKFLSYLTQTKPELVSNERIIGVSLTTPSHSDFSNITIKNKEVYQEYMQFQNELLHSFDSKKQKIQQQFIDDLNELSQKLDSNEQKGSKASIKGKQLYKDLFEAQKVLFLELTPQSSSDSVKKSINKFREVCDQNIHAADKVMGHGWLYRTVEVLFKAVVGLFAGIGMVLGTVLGQGLAKKEHREAYQGTFFSLNQTDSSKALESFKHKTLGDDKENGLISEEKLNPGKK